MRIHDLDENGRPTLQGLVMDKRRRTPSFLDTSLRLQGILHILKITLEPISFTRLMETSQIKYKKSLLNYLNYCVTRKLISKKFVKPGSKTTGTIYLITDNGRKFLEISQ